MEAVVVASLKIRPIKIMKDKKFKCVLCKKMSVGFGNNPAPLSLKGRCCNDCDNNVLFARLKFHGVVLSDSDKKNIVKMRFSGNNPKVIVIKKIL
jgi:hypothetical protein